MIERISGERKTKNNNNNNSKSIKRQTVASKEAAADLRASLCQRDEFEI
jgi:hypothetical protein